MLCLTAGAQAADPDFQHIDGIEHTVQPGEPAQAWLVYNEGLLNVGAGAKFTFIAVSNADVKINGAHSTTTPGSTMPVLILQGATADLSQSIISASEGPAMTLGSRYSDTSAARVVASRTHFYSGGNHAINISAGSELIMDGSWVTAQKGINTGIIMTGSDVKLRRGSEVDAVTGIRIETAPTPGSHPSREARLLLDDSQVLAVLAAIEVASGGGAGSREAFIQVENGSRLVSSTGTLLRVSQREGDPAAVAHLSVSSSRLEGNIVADAGGVANVTLLQGGHITGLFRNVARADIQQGGTWYLAGDSDVGLLVLAAGGSVSLGAGETFHTLTVRDDLVGEGGTLLFNTVLAGDDGDSDRLHVRGDTEGHAFVHVRNIGGEGAQTGSGIALITVDGQSRGHFALAGRAVSGQYEYFLHKGGVAGGEGNWYLRSQLPEPEPDGPCDADPEAPGCGVTLPDQCALDPALPACAVKPPEPEPEQDPCIADPSLAGCLPDVPTPVLRPEVGAYLGNQSAAMRLFQHRARDRDHPHGGERAWAQLGQAQARRDVLKGQMALQIDERVLRLGSDVLAWGQGGHAGVMLSRGDATTRSRSRASGYSATGKVAGHALGVYAGWRSSADMPQGSHVDVWLQRGWFDNHVQGEALEKTRYDTSTTHAAVEAGHRFALGDGAVSGLTLQPRAQVAYTRWHQDAFSEANGTVFSTGRAGAWSAELGLQLQARIERRAVVFTPYVALDAVYGQRSDPLRLNGEQLRDDGGRRRAELALGAQAAWGPRWSAHAELAGSRGDGRHRASAVRVRLQRRW